MSDDRTVCSAMNVLLLIEHGLDEAMAKRVVDAWELKCAQNAANADHARLANANQESMARALKASEARNEIARKALEFIQSFGCPVCGGDCSSANPPMHGCPMDEISRALRSQSSGGGNG